MFGIAGLEALIVTLLLPALGLFVLYAIIRVAVRHGMGDALREHEAARVRSDLRVGEERSPNSRRD